MRITETVGAIDVEKCDGGVIITQAGLHGEDEANIFVPQRLVNCLIEALQHPEAP